MIIFNIVVRVLAFFTYSRKKPYRGAGSQISVSLKEEDRQRQLKQSKQAERFAWICAVGVDPFPSSVNSPSAE